MSRCTWNSEGVQCKFPGVMSTGLNGGGPWRCAWHFPLGAHPSDQRAGKGIVDESLKWDGTAEQYLAWRRNKARPTPIPDRAVPEPFEYLEPGSAG